ncbi:MAG TPA: 16S rRNA (adenine(1518)-N(6)/adenine(1519)-N(6))-dimethyltransferase RsmA [Candidatus Dormibacteraeota bacterium]|jgi:16S rRNA (adenine1518-N6/adenine1519-N6)-dimethyltransferase|nr:16S rRNA (adenine(1518)-N(6)/adenine(1519)-N(6))-dimethyltransferase RsmA [Candidatus Dormibacteraeota bacterium]
MTPGAPAVAAAEHHAELDLCNPATARAVARRAGLALKRRLGQNLLVDRGVVERLVDALDPGPEDEVYEIGPGIGTLTSALSHRAGKVVSVEIDEACRRALEITQHRHPNVTVVPGDALRLGAAEVGLGPDHLAAGNIPYNLTGALLQRLLEAEPPPRRAVLLVQREVAARLDAGPGDWSLATLAVRSLAEVERLGDVPPGAFDPPPAVHSSILRLTPRALLGPAERAAVLTLARRAFTMRRKTLRHGVTHALDGDAARARAVLEAAGIDPGRRPGSLELGEWRALAAAAAGDGG